VLKHYLWNANTSNMNFDIYATTQHTLPITRTVYFIVTALKRQQSSAVRIQYSFVQQWLKLFHKYMLASTSARGLGYMYMA